MITTLRCPVLKKCPYTDEIDAGEMTITIPGEAPELHNLAWEIVHITAAPITHENFTAAMAARLPSGSHVVTTWHTGPWSVEVREDAPAVAP